MEKDKILNDDLKVIFRGIVKVIAGIFVLWLLLNSYFVVGA